MKSYNNEIRSAEYISTVRDFISENYGMQITDIQPAKRGFYGETWKIITLSQAFFVKIDYSQSHKNIYAQSFFIIEYLNNECIDFISQIVKTKEGQLYIHFNEGILGVFQWIDGINLAEIDEGIRVKVYKMLTKIYKLKPTNVSIPVEKFDGESAKHFFKTWENIEKSDLVSTHLGMYRPLLEHKAKRLSYFSQICKADNTGFVITHGDSSRNIILGKEKNYIIDWDAPLLAPPERDAWLCLSKWSVDTFNSIIKKNDINYELKTDRLSYYGCYSFFLYLKEYIDKYLYESDPDKTIKEIDAFINDWLTKECQYALE